ncbi:hypothetical protein QQF64_029843 [Cirrhinus molitorella]|uniref:DUF4371 domain-containing protein n=1 Tax=Cirrhinus molitorella TaxID=172907 RepID=A0ABR3N1M2_9TELE
MGRGEKGEKGARGVMWPLMGPEEPNCFAPPPPLRVHTPPPLLLSKKNSHRIYTIHVGHLFWLQNGEFRRKALDTTGKCLCETFLGHLETLGLDLYNCQGQSYDNGSNMQGKKQEVQKRVLELNPKALCIPCGSHTLNLVVGDAAKSSVMSISFLGLLQQLYTLFSSSVHRWTILKEHVKNFTLKALSATGWECRVEVFKAIRYQLPEIVKALSGLKEYATEKRDADVVSTAERICQELQRWPFVVSTIVWYNVLFQTNKVSKILQSPKVSVETAREEIRAVKEFLQEFRNHGFDSAKTDVRERYSSCHNSGQIFQHGNLLQALWFLYSIETMRSTENEGKLDECCHRLEQKLDDIDAEDLKLEDRLSALAIISIEQEVSGYGICDCKIC